MTPAEALSLLERVRDGDERWHDPFERACALLEEHTKLLSHSELGRLLVFFDDFDCYYHGPLCTLKGAALREAAARLNSLETSR